jgi:hypothetical protein
MPKNIFLDASSFEKVQVLNELFHRATPVRSTLKSVDGLGAVDTRKRPDFWGQYMFMVAVIPGQNDLPERLDSVDKMEKRVMCGKAACTLTTLPDVLQHCHVLCADTCRDGCRCSLRLTDTVPTSSP